MTDLYAFSALNFDTLHLGASGERVITQATETQLVAKGGGVTDNFIGRFEVDSSGNLVSGTVERFTQIVDGVGVHFYMSKMVAPASVWADAILNDLSLSELQVFGGADDLIGSEEADLFRGQGGDDRLEGRGGADSLFGGTGNDRVFSGLGNDLIDGEAGADALNGSAGDDTIYGGEGNDTVSEGGAGSNYLRGGDGDDLILGGDNFDDAHGNAGNDTVRGAHGDDWVVGGKDNDSLNGEVGYDIVYGNLGADTCWGADGNDIVRGGKDNDLLDGGAGEDWMSGDKGDDTISGGTSADVFHTFGDAGVDRVLDFSRVEGDRVQLDPGTVYTVAQAGADVVISMQGGGEMILVGVNLASLTGDWIFVQ